MVWRKTWLNLHCKYWCMFMHTQAPQGIVGRPDGMHGRVMSEIPEFDFSIATTTDQLSRTPSLQVHIGDPLLVLSPNPYHGFARTIALVVYPHCSIAEAGHKDVACNLVRSQRGDARA